VNSDSLVDAYLAGPGLLRRAVEGLTPEQLDALPIPGNWSIRQVVCHVADAELLYADRIRRILAEDQPALVKADPDRYLAALSVSNRDFEDELALIEAIRRHIGQILAALPPQAFDRVGIHSTDGPLTLHAVLQRVTAHIPHHVAFINAKRQRLAARV
jgi:uncharacterized damage-inducible protein DinB